MFRKILLLSIALIFVSSCGMLVTEEAEEIQEPEPSPIIVTEERDYGPVTSASIQDYYKFQTLVACGENYGNLLNTYNWTVKRVVEIGENINNEELGKIIFRNMQEACPDKIEQVDPTIGTIE